MFGANLKCTFRGDVGWSFFPYGPMLTKTRKKQKKKIQKPRGLALCLTRWSGWVSDWGFKSQLTILQSYRDWNKVLPSSMVWSLNKVVFVCGMYVLRPAASLYSAIPLNHHATGRQWCPNPDHYPDSEKASRSLTPLCWALSRAAEPQIVTSFVWRGQGSNHQPPACQANAQPLHYPAAVWLYRMQFFKAIGTM